MPASSPGDWSLVVEGVRAGDSAVFQCQAGAGRGQQAIRSHPATLTVLSPPGPPVISQGERLEVEEGDQVELECVTRGARPAGELEWSGETGQQILGQTRTETTYCTSLLQYSRVVYRREPGGTFTTRSWLKVVAGSGGPGEEDRLVICRSVTHPTLRGLLTVPSLQHPVRPASRPRPGRHQARAPLPAPRLSPPPRPAGRSRPHRQVHLPGPSPAPAYSIHLVPGDENL